MKDTGKRRAVLKKGKGGAFLRFLIGELVLLAVVGVIYLFVLNGDVSSFLRPAASNAPDGGAQAADATPAPEATEVPVPTDTPVPTATPAPTSTPIPAEELTERLAPEAWPELPTEPSERLKLGLSELRPFEEAGQRIMTVSGYAFIEGMDAAGSEVYLLVTDVGGEDYALYPTVKTPESAQLTFDANSGKNLESAFFTVRLDTADYPWSSYLLSAVVVNGNTVARAAFGDQITHFGATDHLEVWD